MKDELRSNIQFAHTLISLIRDSVLLLVAVFTVTITVLGGNPEELKQHDWIRLVGFSFLTILIPAALYYGLLIVGEFLHSALLLPVEYLLRNSNKVPRSLFFFWLVTIKRTSYKGYVKRWSAYREKYYQRHQNNGPAHPITVKIGEFTKANTYRLILDMAVWGRRIYLILVIALFLLSLSEIVGQYTPHGRNF